MAALPAESAPTARGAGASASASNPASAVVCWNLSFMRLTFLFFVVVYGRSSKRQNCFSKHPQRRDFSQVSRERLSDSLLFEHSQESVRPSGYNPLDCPWSS